MMSAPRNASLRWIVPSAGEAEQMVHAFDAAQVDAVLEFDTARVELLRRQWQELIAIAVWDGVESDRLGAAPRLRKRLLELGERIKSLVASRVWIPHPRERLKSALAAALALRETLAGIDGALPGLRPGPDAARLTGAYQALRSAIDNELLAREARWAGMLDAQIGDGHARL